MARDEAKGTNVHRFGDAEAISFICPSTYALARVCTGDDTADAIISMLFRVADKIDKSGAKSAILMKLLHEWQIGRQI